MNAITRSEYGSPREVLELNKIDMPVIKDDEVLVRVQTHDRRPGGGCSPGWIYDHRIADSVEVQ
jgi:hypothetical protein